MSDAGRLICICDRATSDAFVTLARRTFTMAPMVVLGAAFTADAARDAVRALAQLPDVAPNAIARAPLGAVGRVSEGKVLVAVCITERAVEQVARIVREYGGEIVTRAPYPEGNRRTESPASRAGESIDLSRSILAGRADN
jgi:hypothetical protein